LLDVDDAMMFIRLDQSPWWVGWGYPMKKDMAVEATSLPALQKIFYPPPPVGTGQEAGRKVASAGQEGWGEGKQERSLGGG
jgi:hypothetical protein